MTLPSVQAAEVAAAARYGINQPAQPLADSLQAIARQTSTSLLFDPAVVQGLKARAVSGQYSAAEAVAKALEGTGLVVAQQGGALVVKPAGAGPVQPASGPASGRSAAPAAGPGAQAAANGGSGAGGAGQGGADGAEAAATDASTVVVTGSRLRRIDSEAALPVNIYTRQDIERSGQPTVERFLSSLNEASVAQGEASFNGPTTGQGTVQLRGLPLGSTLVLINGRRVQAVGGSNGNFFNLNLIPLAAVDRIEIVPVGSSAVYGGDALAGVVNVILKRSVNGESLNVRLTSGRGFGDGAVSLATGDSNERGAWMLLGSYSKALPLLMAERSFFQDADYRRFGGTDVRARNCTPGTVTSSTTANLPGLNSTFAGIPASQGQRLTAANFTPTAGQANLCNGLSANGSALIYGTESVAVHGSGDYRVLDSLGLFTELTFVHDKLHGDGAGLNLSNVLVPASNPNNPFGTAVRVTARLAPENGVDAFDRRTNYSRILLGARGEFAPRWDYEATASVSRDDSDRVFMNNTVNTVARTAALATTDPAASLNPFATGRAASDAVLRAIWSDSPRKGSGRKDLAGGFVRGPVLELPAGSVDAIVGAEVAHDRYDLDQPGVSIHSSRASSAVYGELRLPLLKAGQDTPRRWTQLALTVAGRGDKYSDFGSAGTYQAGLEFRPVQSALLRASVATSFKPPTLAQIKIEDTTFGIENASITDPRRSNAPVTNADWVRTTNKDLQPEKGHAYALGALWEPEASGLRMGVTAWRVKIDGLIAILLPQVVVDNEALFPGAVTREPTVNGVPGRITRLLWNEVNFGSVETSGIDVEASQTWRTAMGRWNVGASATRALQYDVVLAPGAAVEERLGKRFSEYWAPKLKGRLTAGFDQGAWSAGITSRYLGAYLDSGTSTRKLGDRWTHDLSASLNLVKLGMNPAGAKSAALSLAVVNVTNQLPEYVNSSPYFDASQGDWRGRYASVRFSMDW